MTHIKLYRLGLYSCFTLILAACASTGPKSISDALPTSTAKTPLVVNQIDFTPYNEGDKQCGPTSLAMMISEHDQKVSLSKIQAMTFTPKANGTYTRDMISAARRLGFATYSLPTVGQMLQVVSEGRPVLVFQNLGLSWAPTWHYAVLVGYDQRTNEVFIHSGEKAYQRMRFKRFKNTWQRGGKWSYVIHSSRDIPIFATFDEALENAMVLESLQKKPEALDLYESMSHRWPDRYEPYVGLANMYVPEDNAKAIHSLKKALEKQPSHPGIYYNLAYIYHMENNLQLAEQMKNRALEVAPLNEREFYEKKLAELD